MCPHTCGLLKEAIKKIVASFGLRGWVCSQNCRIVLCCCRSCFESKHQDKFRAVPTFHFQSNSTQMHLNIHTSVWLADDSQVFYLWYFGDATLAMMASTNISLLVVGKSNALICSFHWGLRQLLIQKKNEVLCQWFYEVERNGLFAITIRKGSAFQTCLAVQSMSSPPVKLLLQSPTLQDRALRGYLGLTAFLALTGYSSTGITPMLIITSDPHVTCFALAYIYSSRCQDPAVQTLRWLQEQLSYWEDEIGFDLELL